MSKRIPDKATNPKGYRDYWSDRHTLEQLRNQSKLWFDLSERVCAAGEWPKCPRWSALYGVHQSLDEAFRIWKDFHEHTNYHDGSLSYSRPSNTSKS